jgi:hypothetical protein
MLPMDKDLIDLNRGPLSIIRSTVIVSQKQTSTHARARNTTRMDGQIPLITTKTRTMTCGECSCTGAQPSYLLRSCIYDGVMGIFHIRIGVWFTALSVGSFSPRRL